MSQSETKGRKLKSALRDNLKKRKSQARKFHSDDEAISMKLRSREIIKKPVSDSK